MSELSDSGVTSDWLERCFSTDDIDTDEAGLSQDDANHGDKTFEDRKGTYNRLRNAAKPHSTPQTLKWLEENYEIAEGVCIPRSTLYVHYLDFCEKHDTQPVNAASFGKIIRQQFPQLTTRRLGTRGQSKYHYYGIGVREESAYYEIMYSAKGVQSSADGKKDTSKQIIAYSPRSKLGTLLPEFPDVKDIKLPPGVSEEKVTTFMMMYRTHCQRILDTVIRANFDEVQNFLLHFWQGIPDHIKSVLDCRALVTLVGVCDTILYRAIANVLMPSVIQPLPDSLIQVIRRFSRQLDEWLRQALCSLPENLQKLKFDSARTVIHSAEITSQMLDDWMCVDLNSIIKQTFYTMDNYSDVEYGTIVRLSKEFEALLEDRAPIESYTQWLDNMVDHCVVQISALKPGSLRKTARQFLLMWSCFGTRVIRDMTLHSAPSFGSFHLLHLMFDEYVLYVVETLHSVERGNDLLQAVRGDTTIDFLEEIFEMDIRALRDPLHVPRSTDTVSIATGVQGDRGSVITHGSDLIQHVLGQSENESEFIPNIQTDSTSYGPYPGNEFRAPSIDGSRLSGAPYGPQSTSYPTFGQPLCSSANSTRQNLINTGFCSYPAIGNQDASSYYGSSTMERIPSLHNEASSTNAHAYEWNGRQSFTSGFSSCTAASSINKILPDERHNLTSSRPQSVDLTSQHRNNVSSRLPLVGGETVFSSSFEVEQTNMVTNLSHNSLQTGFERFDAETVTLKRTGIGHQSGKRKRDSDVTGGHYKPNMLDLYQCQGVPSVM